MLRKFFPCDKNYILENVQLSQEHILLSYLVDFAKVEFLLRNNSLGLIDKVAQQVMDHNQAHFVHLHDFYINCAGVYRYLNYQHNQLEFIFDGRSDQEKYVEEWTNTFQEWVKNLCKHESFVRAILELTVFYPDDYTPQMAGLRLSAFLTKQFDLKIDPGKGITKQKVA